MFQIPSDQTYVAFFILHITFFLYATFADISDLTKQIIRIVHSCLARVHHGLFHITYA